MAYLSSDQFNQDDQQQKRQGQASSSAGAASGGGAAAYGGGTGNTAPPTAAPGASQQGTGFVNAAQYLGANASGASALGRGLASGVQNEGDAAKASISGLQGAFDAGVGTGGAQSGTNQLKNTYNNLTETPGYMATSQQAAGATYDAKALNNNNQRYGLLNQFYGAPGYTGGQQNYDNLYATQGAGNAGLFLKTQQNVGDLSRQLNDATTASQKEAKYAPPVAAPTGGSGPAPDDFNPVTPTTGYGDGNSTGTFQNYIKPVYGKRGKKGDY